MLVAQPRGCHSVVWPLFFCPRSRLAWPAALGQADSQQERRLVTSVLLRHLSASLGCFLHG